MSGPVLLRVGPIAGEGLMSLVTRSAAGNLLPSAHILLRQVGVSHPQNPNTALNPILDQERLASILRVPLDEVAKRRHTASAQAGFVDFFGASVRSDEVITQYRRFAPSALASSAHDRALWSLKMVPCCIESWEYLTDRCACGAKQRWQSAYRLDRCGHCNQPLDNAVAASVDPALRDGLGFLIGLLDPIAARRAEARRQLPPALNDWDGGMVFELALALTPLTPAGYRPKRSNVPPPSEPAAYAAALSQAADLVRSWPTSLISGLEARVAERSRSKINVRYLGIDAYIAGLDSSFLPPVVRLAVLEQLEAIQAEPGSVPAGQIGMREAALLTGQEESRLARARRAGLLQTRVCLRSNRLLPTLDRTEIELIHDFLSNRIGLEKASNSFGLPQYAILLLADEGLLTFSDHPYLLDHHRSSRLHARELAHLRRSLAKQAVPLDQDNERVRLDRVAREIGRGPKPWGRIFRALHDRRVSFSMEGESIKQIFVSSVDAARLKSLAIVSLAERYPGARCSQRDALEALNLHPKEAIFLKGLLQTGDDSKYAWDEIEQLARSEFTIRELFARAAGTLKV